MAKAKNTPVGPGGGGKPPLIDEKAVSRKLKPFLANNPGSRVRVLELSKGPRALVYDPWSDASLVLVLDGDYSVQARALNELILPPRYRAIYHRDIREVEVIWTAWKLDEDQDEIRGRSFKLDLNGTEHPCAFAEASEQLLMLAKMHLPIGISDSDFRNLRSFAQYLLAKQKKDADQLKAFGTPTSFRIGNVDWNEEGILDLIRHVNFYLRYYDSQSPVVLIHPVKPEQVGNPRNRYFEGFDFPNVINSRPLDQSLLILWGASFTDSRPANFLNFYRIIEYVSYSYVQEAVKQEIKSIIKRPHALHDVERTAGEIMLTMRELKAEREQDAIIKLLKAALDPKLLWREVCQNTAFFSKATEFEGGVTIEPITSEKDTEETFRIRGGEAFARALTQIRNALAHGKDTKTAKTILPTSYNFDLLEPWIHLISAAAGEVVLWEGTH